MDMLVSPGTHPESFRNVFRNARRNRNGTDTPFRVVQCSGGPDFSCLIAEATSDIAALGSRHHLDRSAIRCTSPRAVFSSGVLERCDERPTLGH